MNDYQLPFQELDVYRVAKEFVVAVQGAKVRDSELLDQSTRAAKSAFLNLAEGLPNDSVALRRKYFVSARNSLYEAVAAVDVAHAIGAVDDARNREVAMLGVQLAKLLRGLMR